MNDLESRIYCVALLLRAIAKKLPTAVAQIWKHAPMYTKGDTVTININIKWEF